MLPVCRVCGRRIARWHNARLLDAAPVEGFWADFCLRCRIVARLRSRWFLNGWCDYTARP